MTAGTIPSESIRSRLRAAGLAVTMVGSAIVLSGCAALVGAAVGGAAGYVAGSSAAINDAENAANDTSATTTP